MPSHEEQVQALQEAGAFPMDYAKARLWYQNFVVSKLDEIRNGAFARESLRRLPDWARHYSQRFALLTKDGPLTEMPFVQKPFHSVVDKLYREVIISGKEARFENCFGEMDDLIRLTLTSPYGDGPKFLGERFRELGVELSAQPVVKERANEYGYYAVHFTYRTEVGILSFGESEPANVHVCAELQLTTQLQSSLRDLTHELYEARRLTLGQHEWRWDFDNEMFRPSYIGHNLHLLESLILEMKNKRDAQ